MKKIKSWGTIVGAVLVWILLGVIFQKGIAFAFLGGDIFKFNVEIEYINVPENTEYVDVLIQMDSDDPNYVDFTQAPQWYKLEADDNGTMREEYMVMPITRHSEIAQLNEEGYISLSLHHKDIKAFLIYDQDAEMPTYVEYDRVFLNEVYEEYEDFKVACVDTNGRVLEVWDVKAEYAGNTPNLLTVDGESCVLQICGVPVWFEFFIIALAFVLPLYVIIFMGVLCYKLGKWIKGRLV